MSIRDSYARWGTVSQLLHWLFVALLIVQVVLGLIDRALPLGAARSAVIGNHKSLGITILALAAIRLLWRWANPVPDPPLSLKPKEQALARFTQVMLYVLLFGYTDKRMAPCFSTCLWDHVVQFVSDPFSRRQESGSVQGHGLAARSTGDIARIDRRVARRRSAQASFCAER
jgi:Prokaryotic cytochrome b561